MTEILKILHLESIAADAELAEMELRKANILFEKMVVDDKATFIKAVEGFKPDIIISDDVLPSFNWIQALKMIKDRGLKIPFILLTANISEEFEISVIKEGASDYIRKKRLKRLPLAVLHAMERNRYDAERQKNWEQIAESEALMKKAQQLAHFGSWEVDLETGKVRCSDEALRILEYDAGETEFTFENFSAKLYKEDIPYVKKEIHTALSGMAGALKLNFRMPAANGAIKYILAELIINRDETNKPVRITGFSQDVTAQKKVEIELRNLTGELRSLAAKLQDIREEERAEMAREIHDELGQQLTGLKMDMSWILKKINAGDGVLQKKIIDSVELINQTIKTVRKIATELRPSILDDLGLIDALEWQSHEFSKRYGISIEFNASPGIPPLPKNIITGIFRIYQESLTNVARHAGATSITTSVKEKDGQLILNIRDNGKGFDVMKVMHKKTLGLMGMKERCLMIGGKYIIMSEMGKGTSVLVSVPVG